jgi:hypothetical protein
MNQLQLFHCSGAGGNPLQSVGKVSLFQRLPGSSNPLRAFQVTGWHQVITKSITGYDR